MKNIYLKMKTWSFIFVLLLTTTGLMAQDDITWNGSVSSDVHETANWTPATTMAGNNIIFGNSSTYVNAPIVTGTTLEVNQLRMWAPNDSTDNGDGTYTQIPAGVFTINMDEGATFRILNPQYTAGDYFAGTIDIVGGNFHYLPNKNFYLDNNASLVKFNCDTATFRNLIALGDRDGTKGGRLEITGSSLVQTGSLIRVPTGLGREHIYITDDAEMRINGDVSAWLNDLVTAGALGTAPDRDVVIKYDPLTVKTYITTRLKSAFVIEPTDRQLLIAGETGSTVSVIQNDGYASMTGGVQWVYGTVDGTFDQTFSPDQTGPSIDPVFPNSGEFYMALKGIDGVGTTHYTNSIQILVSSNKAILSPDATQNLRLGQIAAMVTVTETPAATSRQWKYSTTPGGPYMAFTPDITGPEFSADFTEAGMYFVVCESMIDGNMERTKEVQFNVTALNAAALNLTFTGANGTDANDLFNWDPAAYIHNNNITIPADMNAIVTKASKDTIRGITIGLNGLFTLNSQSDTDTLWYRADHQSSDGSFLIEKGVFIKDAYYFRLYSPNTSFTVTGDAKAIMNGSGILLGGSNTPADGSNMYIQDNAIILFNTWPGRISANEGYGEFHLQDDAKYQFAGDARGTVAPWITGTKDIDGNYTFYPKFITPSGFVPYMVYDPATDLTTVSARDLSAFGIEQINTQIVGKGQKTNPLSLINSGAYSSFTWKFSTSATGPFDDFTPAMTGATAQVSFADPGLYYVVCYGDGVDMSSNAVPVKVVDIAVTPEDTQYIPDDADGTELTVTLPEGATGIQWKYATVSGGPYSEFLPQELQATYLPWGDTFLGNHYIVYEATVTDDEGQQVTVYSNEVAIMVGATAIGDNAAAKIKLYPNPSAGKFFVELEEGEASTVEIINAAGATVSSQVVKGSGKVELSVSTKGLYLVKVTSGDSVSVKRVIIK